jgi:hypothetical protein
LQRGIATADDFGLSGAIPLDRVSDQRGDVLLVFDNENVRFMHAGLCTIAAERFAAVSPVLNLSTAAGDMWQEPWNFSRACYARVK